MVLDGFTVRRLKPKDIGFVAKTWKESLYQTGQHCSLDAPWRSKSRSVFFARVNAPIDVLLEAATIDVVLDPIDRTYIVAWICYDAENLHYVYVRDAMRGLGIAQALLTGAGMFERKKVSASHWVDTDAARHLLAKLRAFYMPERVYRAKDQINVDKGKDPSMAGHKPPVC